MPLREVRKIYTKSELAIMAWRSSETAANMQEGTNPPQGSENSPTPREFAPRRSPNGLTDAQINALEERLAPIAYKLTDKNGELDLRKLTGPEAQMYFGALGFVMPAIVRQP